MTSYDVTENDTAQALGSGDVPVLATPRLLAWMEAETVRAAAAHLDEGRTSVGTAVRIVHAAPTPVGGTVEITAEGPADPAQRIWTFTARATDARGRIVGEGEIDRAPVDRERFLERLAR
ncbi:thioesterase family protein [Brachybacterium sp. NPDC056505]|uniref:thioesterase family protein n=1 Tax=Brachybacterium sp. NPDC056505 TaxID=3345843 RepID=UPI00366DCC8A